MIEQAKRFISFVGIFGSSLIIINAFIFGATVLDAVIRVVFWLVALYIFFRFIEFLLKYNHDIE